MNSNQTALSILPLWRGLFLPRIVRAVAVMKTMAMSTIILTMLWLASGSSDAAGEAPRVNIVSPAHGAVFQVSFVRKRVIRPSADLPDLSTGLISVNPRACF